MNEYLLSVIGVVILASVLLAIIPEGKTTAMIKGTTKMACLLVVVSPIVQYLYARAKGDEKVGNAGIFFQESVIDEDLNFLQYNYEIRVRLLEQALQQELQELYLIEADITLEYEMGEELQVYTICVKPKNALKEDIKAEVCEYLEKKYCSEVLLE